MNQLKRKITKFVAANLIGFFSNYNSDLDNNEIRITASLMFFKLVQRNF